MFGLCRSSGFGNEAGYDESFDVIFLLDREVHQKHLYSIGFFLLALPLHTFCV